MAASSILGYVMAGYVIGLAFGLTFGAITSFLKVLNGQ